MKRLLQFFIFLPLALILIVLSVANRQEISLSLDPFSQTSPWLVIDMPLYWLIFFSLLVGVIFGGVASWIKQGKFRRLARQRHYEAAKARYEVNQIKQQVNRLQRSTLPVSRG